MEKDTIWKRDVLSWTLYDFANTIYSMNIVSLYLKRYIIEDLHYDDRYFDIPFAISMIIAAALLPALGAISDVSARKKIFLVLFTVTSCLAVGFLALVPAGMIIILMFLFVIANFAYEAGLPFYNALLYSVAEGVQARFVSGVGVALGYVGSVAGMVMVLPFVSGSLFGVNFPFVTGTGKTGAFVPTAILFLLFSLPLFFWVREKKIHVSQPSSLRKAYRDVYSCLHDTRRYPGVLRFLIADYFFEDAVATVIINIGLYCSLVLGMADKEITVFLIVSTVSAVAGSYVIGLLARKHSLKNLLYAIMFSWVAALLLFTFSDNPTVVWTLGSFVGILLGGLWTTSRPFLAELVPREELGRFFGVFSLSGRAAAVIGPLVWTSVVYLLRPERPIGRWLSSTLNLDSADAGKLPYRAAVLSLSLMVCVGLFVFRKVPHTRVTVHG